MSCLQTISDYGLRSLGIGERLLPKTDITICEQFVLIGSGLFWNIYFAIFALSIGFISAISIAIMKNSSNRFLSLIGKYFIFIFRGSPLFIQFFCAYEIFVLFPKIGIDLNLIFIEVTLETRWLTRAWLGALIVLYLNTTAYSAEIFYGALKSIPKADIDAANSLGLSSKRKFIKIIYPNMLRFSWPSYTNEAIFLFHATSLVFFSGFPAWGQSGDALYYANYFADKTFNPFIPYPIIAFYFILLTLVIIGLFGIINTKLNKHLPSDLKSKTRIKINFIR